MTIELVGYASATSSGTDPYAVALTGLTGGLASAPAEDDLVLVITGWDSNASSDPGVTSAGYTEAVQVASPSGWSNLAVAYKRMGATPDTTVQVANSGDAAYPAGTIVSVWRGIDAVFPLDVAPTSAGDTGGSRPDSPAITPLTAGAMVLTLGIGGPVDPTELAHTAPSGYDDALSVAYGLDYGVVVDCAAKPWSGDGAEDPAAWTGGNSGTSDDWAAATIALRPAFDGTPGAWLTLPASLGAPAVLVDQQPAGLLAAPPIGAPAAFAGTLVQARLAGPPLGPVRIFGIGAFTAIGAAVVPTPLGAPALLAREGDGFLAIAAPLGAPALAVVEDFTGALVDGTGYYVLDISGGAELLRLPMSSWQATQQTGYKQFLQAVVPAVLDYVSELSDRKSDGAELIVSRGARLADGTAFEYELCRGPLAYLRFDRGASNYSATLSGYADAAAAVADPSAYARTLSGVRSTSVAEGTVRARCAIDWLVRPGHQVTAGDETFTVSWISYFVSTSDAYMDTGSRAA